MRNSIWQRVSRFILFASLIKKLTCSNDRTCISFRFIFGSVIPVEGLSLISFKTLAFLNDVPSNKICNAGRLARSIRTNEKFYQPNGKTSKAWAKSAYMGYGWSAKLK